MSGVFHSVRTTAPGVPLVPKPPGPRFQDESSKSGWNQSSRRLLETCSARSGPVSREVGTTSRVLGIDEKSALVDGRRPRASTLMTARS